ncbi:response regulator [Flagellimonas sp. HMM57]|uniref:response regulator n=1 Tax=unclassified Flagellimonas TaxID=2644544 RepID=UPI0013D50F71|nr:MULTISPECIES: response regulator [unclassified Flagellimonas]MBS9463439.1 response regulator [Flagellimonas sp. 389]UII75774.1 response regulator [Flagellimonas sp. HMM57]
MRKLKSILLVDDDETTNFLNKFFIRQLDNDLTVNTVTNGEEAIEFLEAVPYKKHMPCLLILDTNMPIMNGWEFLDVYEKKFDKDFKKNVIIVMLTALDTEAVTAMAMSNPNVTDTAQKPLSDLKFRVLINKYFS